MLTGNGKKMAAFDSLIKNTESIRDSLKEQLARVMGIGSESADKDMLRKGGGNETYPNPSSRLQFNAEEPRQVMGLDDEEKPEPLKNPTEKAEDDFDDYLDINDFNNREDYLDTAAEHIIEYLDNKDINGFNRFMEENNLNNPFTRDQVWEHVLRQKELKSMHHEITEPDQANTIIKIMEDGTVNEIGLDNRYIAKENLANYEIEKQQRLAARQYNPSKDFSMLISNNLKSAQNSLDLAKKAGNTVQIAEYEEKIAQYESIERIFTDSNSPNSFKYQDLGMGLQAIQSLAKNYQEDLLYARNSKDYQEVKGKLDLVSNEIISINGGMNVVGEAYLDDIDELYKSHKMSPADYKTSYREYYQSVIDRESLIKIESRSLNEDNLTINDGSDYHIMGVLEAFDVPLYSTEKDAVFAFKKEAMPLTLERNKEHSAVLDNIDILDMETGEVKTYYYYLEVKQGADRNVIFNAIIGAGGGKDRKLLHTHPVDGYWSRNFSGDPENHGLINKYIFDDNPKRHKGIFGEMGDSSVPGWMAYGGIYVVGSGAEVKLYEGYGEAGIGSGNNTYANTKNELSYVSTVDLY